MAFTELARARGQAAAAAPEQIRQLLGSLAERLKQGVRLQLQRMLQDVQRDALRESIRRACLDDLRRPTASRPF
jgi:hypothetical protein